MNKLMSLLRVSAVALALGLGLYLPSAAFAVDRVTMKDGKVHEGTIVKETDCCIWVKTTANGTSKEVMVFKSDTQTVDRNVDAGASGGEKPAEAAKPQGTPAPAVVKPAVVKDEATKSQPEEKPAPAKEEEKATPAVASGGAPKAAIITLGDHKADKDMVGIYMTANILRDARKVLETELGTDKTGVVVFRVSSGGGFTREVQLLSDEIHNEYKKRFRVVAWIESAISAAAMTSHCIEEIYFTPQGNYGAATEFSGPLVASKGAALEIRLAQMRSISQRGGYDPLIARAMQIQQALSCTIDENGDVSWYPDATSGKIVVNRDNEILTFNERLAREVGFSKGTASTIQELQKLMGFEELEWVGTVEKGVPWPVSKAEKLTKKFRDQMYQFQELAQVYYQDYLRNVAAASAAAPEDRPRLVGRAREALNKLKRMADSDNWGLVVMAIGAEPDQLNEWIEQQEKILRDLLRK